MKYPVKVRHRGQVLAKIYKPSKAYPLYRVSWHAAGKRFLKSFPNYAAAKKHADQLVRDLAKGSQAAFLAPGQAAEALAAFQRLQALYESTGTRLSLIEVVSQYCIAVGKLNGYTLGEIVDRGLTSAETITPKLLADAVTEFIEGRKHLTQAKEGKRAKHSSAYEYHVAFWLRQFADTFPGSTVAELSKESLNTYIAQFNGLSAKTRNDRRAVVKQFLSWCTHKDYLPQHHRLFEAVGFKAESTDLGDIDFYRPKELQAMLANAGAELLPVIAMSGLAGLRIEECLRLSWRDVWHVDGHIEISARIAKGRQRRLVTMVPALAQWLEPYRNAQGPVCTKNPMQFNRAVVRLREQLGIPARRNGLRHGFITFAMAKYSNENLVAVECGNSPQIIHAHYRGLATKTMAETWFSIAPKTKANVIDFPIGKGAA